MSNLRYLSLPELLAARRECNNKIKYHGSRWSGQRERLKWVQHYLDAKEKATAKAQAEKWEAVKQAERTLEVVELEEGHAYYIETLMNPVRQVSFGTDQWREIFTAKPVLMPGPF